MKCPLCGADYQPRNRWEQICRVCRWLLGGKRLSAYVERAK